MTVGVPKEIKEQESRVAMVPSGVRQLTSRGHRVVVETNAGIGADYSDEEYRQAGAEILDAHEDVFAEAEMIVKVKEPLTDELNLLTKDHILFTYLHLAASKKLTELVLKSGCTAIAYETVSLGGRLPLLEPMSEVAGRMSVLVGGYHLAKHAGGRGTLLGGVPGVLPGRVVVLGGGTCGVNAAKIATGIGAQTTILEIDHARMRFLDDTLTAQTMYSSEAALLELLPRTDLLIGAVLVPGAKAPNLVTREMLKLMRNGTVLVDIAVDQGGCIETTRPTTHEDPVFVEEGVIHYCVANMPGAFARTSTQALTSVTFPYVQLLASQGLKIACEQRPELIEGINAQGGKLTYVGVAEAHDMKWSKPEL
ncbi:MAG: alanine dehydrogenase [Verrucomicrobiota bacterium]